MKEFKIEFLGPQPASRWPPRHSKSFQKVRDIGRCYFEDLEGEWDKGQHSRPSLPLRDLKRRVKKLKRSFKVPGDDPVNEATLRGSTEHLVFSRFSAEVKW